MGCSGRINFFLVAGGSKAVLWGEPYRHKQVLRKASCRRIQRHGFAFEMQDGEMRRCTRKDDLIVRRGADRILAGLQPFKARERKPAVRFEEIRGVRRAPRSVVFLPRAALRERSERKNYPCREDQC